MSCDFIFIFFFATKALRHKVFKFIFALSPLLLVVYAPDGSEKLRGLAIYFFLEAAEQPEEAPADSLEKKSANRELATNSWNKAHYFIYSKNGQNK